MENSILTIVTASESLEMAVVAQRIDNALTLDGLCIYNQDEDFEQSRPCLLPIREILKDFDYSSKTFTGWNGIKNATMVDLDKVPNKDDIPIFLRENSFADETIKKYEQNNHLFMAESVAVHVDLLDSDDSWFEFIVNKSLKKESEKKDRYIKIQIKHADYSVRLYYVEKSDPELDLRIISTKNNDILEIRANNGISKGAIEFFVKQINDDVKKRFAYLRNNPKYPNSWKSGVSEERIESTYQYQKKKETESKERWLKVGRERYINQIKAITTDSTTSSKPPTLSEIRTAVRNNKGYYTNQSLKCRICHIRHFGGYRFYLGNYNFLVCKYCYQDIKQITPFVKVILTNMGGKR